MLGGRLLARRHRLVVRRATRDSADRPRQSSPRSRRSLRARLRSQRAGESHWRSRLSTSTTSSWSTTDSGIGAGTTCWCEVALVLERGRAEDRAFRIGGDEFALLMPGADGGEARVGLERILAEASERPPRRSITVGIAVLPGRCVADPAVLWEQADAALYEGKRSGGAAIVVSTRSRSCSRSSRRRRSSRCARCSTSPDSRSRFSRSGIFGMTRSSVYEALARPWAGYGFDGPADMFAVAEKIGRAHELDAICRATALARAHELPDDSGCCSSTSIRSR